MLRRMLTGLLFVLCCTEMIAQNNTLKVTKTPSSFSLFSETSAAVIYTDSNDAKVSGNSLPQVPSVKFCGIFLNNEDWGLRPRAAKTDEPETVIPVLKTMLEIRSAE